VAAIWMGLALIASIVSIRLKMGSFEKEKGNNKERDKQYSRNSGNWCRISLK